MTTKKGKTTAGKVLVKPRKDKESPRVLTVPQNFPAQPSSTAEALRVKTVAKRKRAYADESGSHNPTGADWERNEARDMDERADEYLDLGAHTYPRERPQIGRGRELTGWGWWIPYAQVRTT